MDLFCTVLYMWYVQVNINEQWHSLISKKTAVLVHPKLFFQHVHFNVHTDAIKFHSA